MNFRVTRPYQVLVGAAAVLLIGPMESAFAARTVRLDAGAVIPVRLNDPISSNDSHKGDSFTATVKTDETGAYGLPSGTKIDGVVQGAKPQRDKDPGVLEIAFRRVRLPDGRSYPVEGSLIGLDNKSVDRTSDGRLIAKPSHKNDRLTYVGYGAGAGLILGLITKRPLEDTLLGGILGYGFGALQKGHSDARDVVLKPGTELGVRIDRSATLTSDTDASDYSSDRLHRTAADTNRATTEKHNYGAPGSPDVADRPNRTDERDTARSDNQLHRSNEAPAPDRNEIGVLVDDKDVVFNSTARPITDQNGIVMVPAFPVLIAAGIPYTYNATSKTVRATGAEPVRLTVGSSIAVVNGSRRVRLEGPAVRLNGTLYVPMKFLSVATGYDVSYDRPSKTVILSSR